MKTSLYKIDVASNAPIAFVDITASVKELVEKSNVKDGIALVFSDHTTAGIRISEKCDRLQEDMKLFLEQVVPQKKYRHDEQTVDDRPNARGHIMSLLMNSSETLPISEGKIGIGTWQSIFFVELDGPRCNRSVSVKIIGE